MSKKRHIDFIIHEDDSEVIVFRFLPRQSHCHSFDDDPPKTWEDVYKVYYSYKIFKRDKNDNYTKELFSCDFDEHSIIRNVSADIQRIVNGEKVVLVDGHPFDLLNKEIIPLGGNGVSWVINEIDCWWKNEIGYEIVLWKYNGVGYRFYLWKDDLKAFGEYLNECCEHMLANGEPI